MKQVFTLLFAAWCSWCFADEPPMKQATQGDRIPLLEVSVDPAGFLFYGPSVDVGLGIGSKTSVKAYVRGFALGGMSIDLKDEAEDNDEFSGMHIGAGLTQFLTEGGNGIYFGGQVEFGSTTGIWLNGDTYEWWEESKDLMFTAKAGYRYAMENGLFINGGVYGGAINMKAEWDYDDSQISAMDDDDREHTSTPGIFGVEVSVGIAIL